MHVGAILCETVLCKFLQVQDAFFQLLKLVEEEWKLKAGRQSSKITSLKAWTLLTHAGPEAGGRSSNGGSHSVFLNIHKLLIKVKMHSVVML